MRLQFSFGRAALFLSMLLALSSLLTSCTQSYASKISDAQKSFYSGNFKAGARALLPKINQESNEKLLYMIEAGMMLHAGADYETSNRILMEAAELKDELAISVSKQATSLLLNERSTKYHGEDFEHVLIHMYIGLNFIMMDEYDSARVEFQKVNYLLRDIRNKGGAKYNFNIMAKYLTAICYELISEIDNDWQALQYAYTEYRQIYRLNRNLPMVKRDLIRTARMLGDKEDLAKWQAAFGKLQTPNTRRNGELIVIHQAGRGPYKKSRGSVLDDDAMKASIYISLNAMTLEQGVTAAAIIIALKNIEHPIPDYISAENKTSSIAINDEAGNRLGKTVVLENIESTARLAAEKRYETTKKKVAAGIALKAAATVASSIAAEKIAEQTSASEASKLIGFVTGAVVGTTLASQIKPDLRCWHSLPANLQLSRIALQPGEYKIKIDYLDKSGTSYMSKIHSVKIEAGRKSFINIRTLN